MKPSAAKAKQIFVETQNITKFGKKIVSEANGQKTSKIKQIDVQVYSSRNTALAYNRQAIALRSNCQSPKATH